MKKHRYIISKLEIEILVAEDEIVLLENDSRKMSLPQLLTVWEPEIISSKLYIQLKNIGEEHNAKKKKRQRKTKNNDSSIQHGGVSDSAESLDPRDGEGTYLSDLRRRVREVLEDQAKVGGEDREGGNETEA